MKNIYIFIFCVLLGIIYIGCAGSQTISGSNSNALDNAIRKTSDYLNENIQKGSKLVILNFQSEYPALSEYIVI